MIVCNDCDDDDYDEITVKAMRMTNTMMVMAMTMTTTPVMNTNEAQTEFPYTQPASCTRLGFVCGCCLIPAYVNCVPFHLTEKRLG